MEHHELGFLSHLTHHDAGNAQPGAKLRKSNTEDSWKALAEVVQTTPERSTNLQNVNRIRGRKLVPGQPAAQVQRPWRGKAPDQPEDHEKKGTHRCLRGLCCKSLQFLIASTAGFVAIASLIWATVHQPQQPLAFILPAILGSLSIWALALQHECDMVAARTSAIQNEHHLVHEYCTSVVCDRALQRSQDSVGGKDAEVNLVGFSGPDSVAPSMEAPEQHPGTDGECVGHHALAAAALQPASGTEGGGALADHVLVAALVSEYLRSARELRGYEERYGHLQELPLLHREKLSDEGVEPPHATVVPQQACFSDDLLCKLGPAVEPLHPASRAPPTCFSGNVPAKISPTVQALETFTPAPIAPQTCFSDDMQSKLSPAVEALKTFKPASRAPRACVSDDLRSKLGLAAEQLDTVELASRAPQVERGRSASKAPQVARGPSPATAASFSRAAALAERVRAMDTEAPMVSLSRGRI